ncbi:MAG: hypothetical protein JNL77_06700 [Nitrosomonas sp.]|nr:hypothetical protein [Nitrosomonas sp.]
MKNLIIRSFALFITISITGCATIMGQGKPETLNVRSTPERAKVIITDETGAKIFEGLTPTSLSLEKKKEFFRGKKYDVQIISLNGEEKTITVNTKVGGWYFGNLLLGGLIGLLIVDPATGGMWVLDTNDIDVTFNTLKQGALKKNVVLLENVPLALRSKMIEISQP